LLNDDPRVKKLLPFTAHKMKLGDDLYTTPTGYDCTESFLFAALLERNGGSFSGKRVLDLGCLEGGYTIGFAIYGAKEAVGIDARRTNIERCNLVKEVLGIKNVNFLQKNVKEVGKDDLGVFDIIFLSGLLYHLDDPRSFLEKCRDLMTTDGTILIDTHVASPDFCGHQCLDNMAELTMGDAKYYGRWCIEYPESATPDQIETALWSSYGNSRSFFPLEESLIRMMRDAGFNEIEKFERPDYALRCQDGHENCRVTFIVKRSDDPSKN